MGQCQSSVCKLSLSGVAASQVQACGRRGPGEPREPPVATVPLASWLLCVVVRNPSRSLSPCSRAMQTNPDPLVSTPLTPGSHRPLSPAARSPPGHHPDRPYGYSQHPRATHLQGQASAGSPRTSVVGLDLSPLWVPQQGGDHCLDHLFPWLGVTTSFPPTCPSSIFCWKRCEGHEFLCAPLSPTQVWTERKPGSAAQASHRGACVSALGLSPSCRSRLWLPLVFQWTRVREDVSGQTGGKAAPKTQAAARGGKGSREVASRSYPGHIASTHVSTPMYTHTHIHAPPHVHTHSHPCTHTHIHAYTRPNLSTHTAVHMRPQVCAQALDPQLRGLV